MKLEERLAYLAGFFDGEGTVSIFHRKEMAAYNGKKYENWRLLIRIGNNCSKPLRKFKKMFGGNFSSSDHPQSCKYIWCAQGATAAGALLAMYPYLLVKKKQAEVGIKFNERMGAKFVNRRRGLTTKEKWIRSEMRLEIRRLNARYSKASKNRLLKEGFSSEHTDNQKPWDADFGIGRGFQSASIN